ncbi:MAG: fibronectin type III domain-containing protein [Candidatus Woesebacteria bacterium]|jgi:hypothetical protein
MAKLKRVCLLVLGLFMSLFSATVTNVGTAYSMSGSGTSEDPYQIATCSDLQDISLHTSSYYVLTGDIDCSESSSWNGGLGFAPINGFSGSLNGQGYKIENFTINRAGTSNIGMFGSSAGAATIQNLSFIGASVTGGSYTGVLIGLNSSGTTIQKVAISGSVTGTTDAGLLAGSLRTGSSVSEVAVTGTLYASSSYSGGMVGILRDSTITNSYANVTMTGNTNSVAGLAGSVYTNSGTAGITNSYSAGSIASTSNQAGLVGETATSGSTMTFTNNFSVMSLQASGSRGAMFGFMVSGTGQMNISGQYFDATAANSLNCNNTYSIAGCTAVNTDGTDGSHFENTTAVAPLSSWDFTNVWQQTSGLPTLRNASFPSTPGTPTDLTVTAGTSETAELSWTAPSDGGSSITDYSIQYQVEGAGSWTSWSHTASAATSASVTGLTNGTTYLFRVAAVNGMGMGSYATSSGTLIATTPSDPLDFAVSTSDQTASLSWTTPTDDGGQSITDYFIQYQLQGAGSWTTWSHSASVSTSSSITSLTNGEYYGFRVAAINSMGASSYATLSSILVATTPSAPQSLTIISGSDVDLSWSAPADNGGSAVTGYDFYYRIHGASSWTEVADLTSASYTLSGLTSGTYYDYKVAAKNVKGEGAALQQDNVLYSYSSGGSSSSSSTSSSGGSSYITTRAVASLLNSDDDSTTVAIDLDDLADYISGKAQELSLSLQQVVSFTIERNGLTETHTATITEINNDYIMLTVRSTPFTLRIDLGETKPIIIDGSEVMRVSYLGLNADGQADLTFTQVSAQDVSDTENDQIVEPSVEESDSSLGIMVAIGSVLALVIYIVLMALKRKNKVS